MAGDGFPCYFFIGSAIVAGYCYDEHHEEIHFGYDAPKSLTSSHGQANFMLAVTGR